MILDIFEIGMDKKGEIDFLSKNNQTRCWGYN